MKGVVFIYNYAKKRVLKLEKQIEQVEEILETLPPGNFICSCRGKNYKWEQYYNGKKNYIKKNNRKLAEKLAYKKFLTAMLNDLKNEKLSLEFYLRHRNPEMPEHLKLLEESPGIQKLISPYFIPTNEELKKWMEESYDKYKEFPEHLKIDTFNGIKVRSKSEAFICNQLYMQKIPFRYECALYLGNEIYYPDFTIRHPKTGEIYYWEHLGAIDKPEYVWKNYRKIRTYNKNRIYQTENLILSYETAANPFDEMKAKKIIEEYFI